MKDIGHISLGKRFWLFSCLFLMFLVIPQPVNAAENENEAEIEMVSPKDGDRYTTHGRNQTLTIAGWTKAASGVEVTVKYSIISWLCGIIPDLPCEKVKIVDLCQ